MEGDELRDSQAVEKVREAGDSRMIIGEILCLFLLQKLLTFCSIIKSSLLNFLCRLSTIVQIRNPLGCVDSGTNFK